MTTTCLHTPINNCVLRVSEKHNKSRSKGLENEELQQTYTVLLLIALSFKLQRDQPKKSYVLVKII